MQFEMNKCFLLNPEIKLAKIKKTQKTHTLILKNDVTETKARLL